MNFIRSILTVNVYNLFILNLHFFSFLRLIRKNINNLICYIYVTLFVSPESSSSGGILLSSDLSKSSKKHKIKRSSVLPTHVPFLITVLFTITSIFLLFLFYLSFFTLKYVPFTKRLGNMRKKFFHYKRRMVEFKDHIKDK